MSSPMEHIATEKLLVELKTRFPRLLVAAEQSEVPDQEFRATLWIAEGEVDWCLATALRLIYSVLKTENIDEETFGKEFTEGEDEPDAL